MCHLVHASLGFVNIQAQTSEHLWRVVWMRDCRKTLVQKQCQYSSAISLMEDILSEIDIMHSKHDPVQR